MFCYFSNANKTDILQILNKGEIKIEKRETVKKKKEKKCFHFSKTSPEIFQAVLHML